ncbi:MAG: hypothetical protein IDH49_11165 [Gammaproteobacteria bacterium]|nr:hypothetical protein [Gammaproteobacteria bacterium]
MYRKENMLLNVALTGLLIISGAAFAQGLLGVSDQSMPDFNKADADADGFVNMSEAQQVKGLAEAFGGADKNADGKLDAAEYEAALKTMKTSGS